MGESGIFNQGRELDLDDKELSTFFHLLSRLIDANKDMAEASPRIHETNLSEIAETLYQTRRRREILMAEKFGSDLFADPAWDILLELFIQNSRGRGVNVTAACAAAMVPITTALRYINILADRGLITRSKNPEDGRSYLLHLSDSAMEIMSKILAESRSEAGVGSATESLIIPLAMNYSGWRSDYRQKPAGDAQMTDFRHRPPAI